MVDKYSISLAKPDLNIDESNAACDVIKSGWLFQGPKVEEFEKIYSEMFNVKHSIAVNSGSSALLISPLILTPLPTINLAAPFEGRKTPSDSSFDRDSLFFVPLVLSLYISLIDGVETVGVDELVLFELRLS